MLLQLDQQLHHCGLHQHVEGRGDLVAYDQARPGGERGAQVRQHRRPAQAHAGRGEDGVGQGRREGRDAGLAEAAGLGDATREDAERAGARERFLAVHPGAAFYAGFGDFGFWRLEVSSVRYIGGYGRMSWVERDAFLAEELKKLGATVKDISLPNMQHAIPAYYVIAPAEASSNLSRFDGVRFGYRCENPVNLEDLYKRSRGEGFGAEVKRRIMVGTYALSAGYYDAYYVKAQQIRRLIKNDFVSAFAEVDVILGPTTPNPAWKLGEKSADPVSAYLEDIYTITANLAGIPGLSMPAGFVDGLPVGVQLLGNYFQEGRLLNVAHQYQQVTDWHKQAPAGF